MSIAAVILCHDSVHRLGPISTQWFYDHGHNGVDIFFAISGLLICSRLMSEEEHKGSIHISEFYIRRAFRILPPAVFYLAILIALKLAIALPVGYPEIGSALLFVRNYTLSFQHLQTIYPAYTSHFWSLAVEEHFYLLLPGLLLFCPRRCRVPALLSLAVVIAIHRAWHDPATQSQFHTDVRLDALFVPAAIAILIRHSEVRAWLIPWLRFWPVLAVLLLAVISLDGPLRIEPLVLAWLMPFVVLGTVLRPRKLVCALPGACSAAQYRAALLQHVPMAATLLRVALWKRGGTHRLAAALAVVSDRDADRGDVQLLLRRAAVSSNWTQHARQLENAATRWHGESNCRNECFVTLPRNQAQRRKAMDSGTKKRLALGFLSGTFNRIAASVTQLIQVPVLLHFWGLARYGEWLILSGVPVYLSFSSIGFGNVAGNEMSMLVGAGDRKGALRVFQSCWWMISLVCCVTIGVMCGVLYLVPVTHLLKLTTLSDGDTKWIIFYLGTSVLLGQLEQLLQAAYRCAGRYAYGSFLESTMAIGAFACMMVTVALGGSERRTALVFSLGNVAGTLLLAWFVRRDIPWIEFGWRHARFFETKRLAGPAIAFMGFPIGNALNLQGTLMAVQYALGPASVGVFGTARTVSRFALQMVQMVNSTFWPEMSMAFGQKKC